MVGQAAEGLDTDDVFNTVIDQFDHFSGEEPSFAGLVSDGNDGLGEFYEIINAGGCLEVDTLFVCPVNRLERSFDGTDAECALSGGLFAGAQVFRLVDLVVEAVEHKAHQVGDSGLRALLLEKVDQVVVGCRRVFDKDFADDTDAGLSLLADRDRIEIPDHLYG